MKYIYYTGIGANPTGKHNVAEFLKIMNKHFNVECSNYLIEQQYKPCIEQKKMHREFSKKYKKNNAYNRDYKTDEKYILLANKCQSKKTQKKTRKCTLDKFIKFSGAENKTKKMK